MIYSKRLRKFHRNFKYNRCQRCRKLSSELIQNDWLDETDGLIYYCRECSHKWFEIYCSMEHNNKSEIRKALRQFMGIGRFQFR
jgi:uncharacterized Zn ribbon protein